MYQLVAHHLVLNFMREFLVQKEYFNSMWGWKDFRSFTIFKDHPDGYQLKIH